MYEPTKLVTEMTNPLHRGSSSTCWVLVRDLAIKMYFFGVISWMQIILTKFLTNLFDEFFDEWQTTSSGPYFVLLPLFWAAQNNYCIEPGFQDVNFLSFFTFTSYSRVTNKRTTYSGHFVISKERDSVTFSLLK